MRAPSGEKATLVTALLMPAQRRADRLPAGGIPQPQRPVIGARDDARAVGRERRRS